METNVSAKRIVEWGVSQKSAKLFGTDVLT